MKKMKNMDPIEFFIDTYSPEAYNYVMNTINVCNASDADNTLHISIKNVHQDIESDIYYFHLVGTWEGYKLFTQNRGVDLNLEENRKYFYSLTHYQD